MSLENTAKTPSVPPHFYGRRHGHKLRPGRQQLVETVLPSLQVSIKEADQTLNEDSFFKPPIKDIWLEIGFGAGEHLAAQALNYPNIGFIGCEPFVNGVASLLNAIEKSKIANIRIFNDDARILLPVLSENSLGRVFVLFSDPWPKKRHHRRRFISMEVLDQLARLMQDGAELRFASDHSGYIRWVLEHVRRHPDFIWPVRRRQDWLVPPVDWAPTRYEAKAGQRGVQCIYLCIRRRPRSDH